MKHLGVWMGLFFSVSALSASLSCSGGQGSHEDQGEAQPAAIWSTHVEKAVDWGPDCFGVMGISSGGDLVYVSGSTSDSGGAYTYGWIEAFSGAMGGLAPEFGNAGKLVVSDVTGAFVGLSSMKLLLLANDNHRNWMEPPPAVVGKLQAREALDGSLVFSVSCGPPAGGAISIAVGDDSAFLLFRDDPVFYLERRLLADGSLVASFGTAGVIATNSGSVGKIVWHANNLFILRGGAGALAWEVEKRNAETGKLDDSFGNGGIVMSEAAEFGEPVGLAADTDGIYVLANNAGFVLSRRLSGTGALMSGFGNRGTLRMAGTGVVATGLSIEAGRIYVATTQRLTSSTSEWRIEAFDDVSGESAIGFGLNGTVSRVVSDEAWVNEGNVISADATGVYISGRVKSTGSGPYSSEILVEKYSND
jgi:hypothetical protein